MALYNMKVYTLDPDSGIAIVNNPETNMLAALVNGKLYSVYDYRPLDGNGRQLRADSQAVIDRLANDAYDAAALDAQREQEKLEAYAAEHAKVVEVEKPASRENFADALQAAFLSTLTEQASGALLNKVLPVAAEKLEKELTDKFGVRPVVHEFKRPDAPSKEVKGRLHHQFDDILNMVMCGEPVYMQGPAGTGKSYLAKQVADALGLEYYYTNCVLDDINLKGFIDANGRYHDTQFYQAFTTGGVFLLDELDASSPDALNLLNNALANGYFDFPIGRVDAHPDFRAMAAGNTCGTGADSEYVGRQQLDAASLDRFTLITVNYDKGIELDIANGDKELVNFVEDFRAATANAGVQCVCSYRAVKRLYKFNSFMDKAANIRASLTKGLRADDIRMIYSKITISNEWTKALESLTKAS